MEALLSLSFDNISARNTNKIRKGLRQIEGLLAQICLSPSSSSHSQSRRHADATPPQSLLDLLASDPAFLEFFRLQESFEWNIATRLIETLEQLLGLQSSPQTELLIASTLTLLQGVLLLHPPSRALFSRKVHLNLLLDLLDPTRNEASTLCAALLVLVTSLLDRPNNARLFETSDGLRTVCSLFQSKAPSVTHDVRMKNMEFFYFYLMPETSDHYRLPDDTARGATRNASMCSVDAGGGVMLPLASARDSSRPGSFDMGPPPPLFASPARSQHRPGTGYSKSSDGSSTLRSDGSGQSWSTDGSEIPITRSIEEKQVLLSEFLGNVDDLVQDLREGTTSFDH